MGLAALTLLTACKSKESVMRNTNETGKNKKESAYRAAYEAAMAAEGNDLVVVAPQQTQTVTPAQQSTSADNTPVRTIQGGLTVVKGEPLRAYSVIVASFMNQANAENLYNNLVGRGYAARVVRTNETINGHTGWYRVAASSYDDKAQAVSSRNEIQSQWPDAWLLYNN